MFGGYRVLNTSDDHNSFELIDFSDDRVGGDTAITRATSGIGLSLVYRWTFVGPSCREKVDFHDGRLLQKRIIGADSAHHVPSYHTAV